MTKETISEKQAHAMAQVCLDLHDALGCKWGDNPYLTISQLKAAAQPSPVQEAVPDYAWPTVADYEKDVGFEVNDAFKMAWGMARTTNALFTQVEKNNG